MPALAMRLVRPSMLVDLNRAGLDGVAANGALRLGATVRQAALADDERVHPLVRAALADVGHVVTRNRGTVGGSIAHADGAAELPLCLVALDGPVVVDGPDGRTGDPAADFFVTHFTTTLASRRARRRDHVAGRLRRGACAFEEFALRAGDFALSMACSVLTRDHSGAIVRAAVAVGAVVDRPTRLVEVEALLVGSQRERGGGGGRRARGAARRPGRVAARERSLPAGPDRHARDAGDREGVVIELETTVNGRVVRETVEPRLLLTDFLRHRLGLTGTHVGCEHGVCGACTVLLDGVAVRGCCLLAVQVDGCEVETVESLAGQGPLTALAGVVPASPCAPVRLLHAGDPDGGDRSALARSADPRRRSSTCSPATSAAARATRRSSTRSRLVLLQHKLGHRVVNLARSLLAACERHPELEAFPGLTYGELLPRVRRVAGGLGRRTRRAGRVRPRQPARDGAPLLGVPVGGAVAVPLSWRLSDEELDYCLGDCGARVVVRDGDLAARRARAPRRARA